MPPKKKSPAPGGAGSEGGAKQDGALSIEQECKRHQNQAEALQVELANRQQQVSEALQARQHMADRLKEVKSDLRIQKDLTADVTTDMTRQYKGMQNKLVEHVSDLESKILVLEDELEVSQVRMQRIIDDKDAVIAQKNLEIKQLRRKIDNISQEFADMLQDTLEQLASKLDATAIIQTSGAPILSKLQDFKLPG